MDNYMAINVMFFFRNNAGLLFLLVVVGVVDAFHKDFAVGDTSSKDHQDVVG